MNRSSASTAGASLGLVLFSLIAVAAAALFVRLGFWQLDRHGQARDAASAREARLAEPPLSLATLLEQVDVVGIDSLTWRRVRLEGRWDYGGEVLIRNRTRNGRPGVHVVTPLELWSFPSETESGFGDVQVTAKLLVLRGWLPAADALTPGTIARADSIVRPEDELVGAVQVSREGSGGTVLPAGKGDDRRPSFAALDVSAIEEWAASPNGNGASYLPIFVRLLPASTPVDANAAGEATPDGAGGSARLGAGEPIPPPPPEADAGPHLGYAIQWFSFAAVAIVGTIAYVRHRRRKDSTVRSNATPG